MFSQSSTPIKTNLFDHNELSKVIHLNLTPKSTLDQLLLIWSSYDWYSVLLPLDRPITWPFEPGWLNFEVRKIFSLLGEGQG